MSTYLPCRFSFFDGEKILFPETTFPSVSIYRQLYFLPEKPANPSWHRAAAPTARNKVWPESVPARKRSRHPFRPHEIPALQCAARSLSFPAPLFLLSVRRKTARPFSPPLNSNVADYTGPAHHCPQPTAHL